ncbi:hypothetical protein PIB30_070783 [Stylosanthes scabra]|uniref:Ribonuclease H1 N-terminal domain-containing protein n=1 Tax=Stylosanthes scabra TaxID=79078 RepID=A0ABU6TN78_9FABA|nr:hypothetical protein [Stylosanthes scabra]
MDGGQGKFYAVRVGRVPGIYETWEEAKQQVRGHKRAQHRSFCVYDDAVQYMRAGNAMEKTGGERGMRRGSEGETVIAKGLRAWSLSQQGWTKGSTSGGTTKTDAEYSSEVQNGSNTAAKRGLGNIADIKHDYRSEVLGCGEIATKSLTSEEVATTGAYTGASEGKRSEVEWLLGVVCGSLQVGDPIFVSQEIVAGEGLGSHGFTVILPKPAHGVEVVAYGPISGDEANARREAARLMLQKLLSATIQRVHNLEKENEALKQYLALES